MRKNLIWSSRPLINIFLCDLFWIMCKTNFTSHADDNTPFWGIA